MSTFRFNSIAAALAATARAQSQMQELYEWQQEQKGLSTDLILDVMCGVKLNPIRSDLILECHRYSDTVSATKSRLKLYNVYRL